ncbi:MAG: FG-GAP-like repeat-containing protein [Nitrospirales bacterium]|nr:FG-GAP-like repeat-containing protein [Nitrospirales bacterium]
MKSSWAVIGIVFAAILFTTLARAHHVVWLDFSTFNLSSFASVNGNSPPTSADVSAIQALIVANMVEDYATFDIYFTSFRPKNGRYSRIKFLPGSQGGYGCAGPDCCPVGGSCTGIGSWETMRVSTAEVYAGTFAGKSTWQGSNATTARIANGISGTASHELGHLLDLKHCRAADDSISLGCSGIKSSTNDQNVTWHIMASGTSWGLSRTERATRDRFFSIHSSRRILYGNFQARNHWDRFGDLIFLGQGDEVADLAYGRLQSLTMVTWFVRLSNASTFGPVRTWRSDAGDAGDIFLRGDVNGDNRDDLVYGRIRSSGRVQWYVRLSTGTSFGPFATWRSDAGDAGDIFRLADVNGDGRDDLVYGRPLSSTVVRWFARLSTGSSFGGFTTWASDAGNRDDIFLIDDVTGDDRADLVYGRVISSTQVQWFVRRSNGTSFLPFETWRDDAGNDGDLFYLGMVSPDDRADLVYGRPLSGSDNRVRWFVRRSTGNSFASFETWSNDAGDAGDLFRLGDGNGDGRLDLFYARPIGMTSLTNTPNLTQIRWFGRLSSGSSFGSFTTWAGNAGDEGDLFP